MIRRVAVLASAVAWVAAAAFAPVAFAAEPPESTLFAADATPAVAAADDDQAVEVGVRFRADVPGTVVGVRFYQGAGNTGPHTGSLWSGDGDRLATVAFPDSGTTGWVTARFAAPVPVKADTTYVASYLAPHGHYAADYGFFDADLTRGPLTAPSAGNGAYVYGPTGGFPTSRYRATNYWVDVLFVATPTTPTPSASVPGSPPAPPSASASSSASAGAPGTSPSHGGGGVGGGGESLPITGTNVAMVTGGGLLLVALGALLLVVARARKARG